MTYGAPNTFNKAPIVSNGIFGNTDLKEEEVKGNKKGKSNLNSIFDYEDSDDEKKNNDYDLEEKMQKEIQDRKKTALFKIEEDDDDDDKFMFKPNNAG